MGTIIGVLLLLIVAVYAFGFWQTSVAKRQYEIDTSLSPDRVRGIVADSFGKFFWEPVSGPGEINMRRRNASDIGVTISVDIETSTDGKTHVHAWMSAWTTKMGLLAHTSGSRLPKKIITRISRVQQEQGVDIA